MPTQLSAGKLRNLMALCDEDGRFNMLAIDQRGSLSRRLGEVCGRKATHADMAAFKQTLVRYLAAYSTGVLTDPIYGYAGLATELPGHVGLLLCYEKTGYAASEDEKGRISSLLENWSVAKAARAGANAVKLLLYYHPDADPAVVEAQNALCRRVGEECREHDLPFLLETVAYALEEPSTNCVAYARRKPDLVARSAAEFSKPEYQVDVLKLEFPGDIKFSHEYCNAVFDDEDREEAYRLSDVAEFCQRVDECAGVPWVILSAGVDIKEFLANVDLACAAGASGFLCGRAIWKEFMALYDPDDAEQTRMVDFLGTEGAINFLKCNAGAEAAQPWWEHDRFGGLENIVVAGADAGEAWHADY